MILKIKSDAQDGKKKLMGQDPLGGRREWDLSRGRVGQGKTVVKG